MADIHLTCPDCGGAISHLCGANLDANAAQLLAQSGAIPDAILAQSNGQAQIAHDFDLELHKPSSQERSAYNKGYDQEFLEFWKVYPIKRDKRKAQLAWRKSVTRLGANAGANRRTAMAQILAGAIRYRDDPNRDPGFTKYAEGWLNGDGWEDEPLSPRRNGRPMKDRAAEILEGAISKGGGRGSLAG